ncbi:uncharacterized protein LOC129921313 [Episyrphus balteatus]|uniref:uncharacterized protein LOC129921313 n=1 Tax=Episyrphus balteatus TaxID=286459 RepID=UPI002485665B|nr:uncharacterized protein LOC129921313 [Episyrphus balteatus]
MSEPTAFEVLNTPSWMNKEFFTEVLKKSEKDDEILVNNIFVTPSNNRSNDSLHFELIVYYSAKKLKDLSKSLIVKTAPESDEEKPESTSTSLTFVSKPNISICSKILPTLEEELRKIDEYNIFASRVLFQSLEPKECIVFENNVPKGYEVMRARHCNMEEVKAAFLKLAKWHAVSYKIANEDNTANMSAHFKSIEEMPSIIPKIQKFIDKLETLDASKKMILKMCITSLKPMHRTEKSPSKGIFVLCHGRFHRENIVFKHNSNGQLEDVKLINLQDCFYGPAMFDVIYAKYTIMDSNIRTNYIDELIHYYSLNFIETLKKLDFQGEIPKVSDFYDDILRIQYPELFHMKDVIIPIWHAFAVGDSESGDVDAIEEAIDKEMETLVPTLYGIQ